MSQRPRFWRSASLLIGSLVLGAGLVWAQEKPPTPKKPPAISSPEKMLIVRDVHVGFVAKNTMNDRTAFRSTLPAVILSQRPVPPKPTEALAQPLGVITFEGVPTENLDVMLEYDNSARLLARWPHTDMRSTRSLWRKLNLVQSKEPPTTPFPTTSWLNPLRTANRLTLQQDKRLEKFILYDLTLMRSPNNIELEAADTGYKARNVGASAIHDVTVYRPAGKGKYRAASVKLIPGLGPSTAPPVQAAGSVPGATPGTTTASVTIAAAQPNVVVQALQALKGGGRPVPAEAVPAEGQPPATPTAPPNTPQHDIAWAGEEQTPAQLLAAWEPILAAQGLSAPEITHVLAILQANAFDKDAARVVFRLDPAAIETLAPLEVTPQPDKLIRVWLVILDGADPEIKTRIQQMIVGLGDPSYEKRMEAKAKLLKLGPTAVQQLNAEKANKDPEIAFRIEEILEEVQNPTDQGQGEEMQIIEGEEIFFDS